MRPISLALVSSLLVTSLGDGCGTQISSGPSAVTGTVWRLQSLELPTGLVAIARPESYTAEFRANNLFSAKADCNVCAGAYSISGASVTIGPLACTRAFCGTASNDMAFIDILTSATRFGVRGTELSLESPKGVARLRP